MKMIIRKLNVTLLCLSPLVIQLGCSSGASTSSNGQLAFVVQPGNNSTPSGTNNNISPTIKVAVLDTQGRLNPQASTAITLSIDHQTLGGIYTALISGNTTVNAVNGVATFNNISLSQPGTGYTLRATASNFSAASSNPFNVNSSIAQAESAGYAATANNAGYEIAYSGSIGSNYQGFLYVYVDNGNNPITTDVEFMNFSCPDYFQNTPRHAIFDYANTIGSPSATPGALTPFTDCQGHTWGLIVENLNYNWPFNAADYPAPQPSSGWQAGQTGTYVPPGELKYSSINKNQGLLFTAKDNHGTPILRFFITDGWGNQYIMKSSNSADLTTAQIQTAFDSAVLPAGWSKSTAYLSQDLYVNPAYSNYGESQYPAAMFTDLRDSADNAYSLVYWSNNGDSIAQQIGNPMPILSAPSGGRLNGTTGDDLMYGSDSDDQFYPLTGNDTIDGGGGYNGVFINDNSTNYTFVTQNGITTVTGPSGTKTLKNIQYVQFANQRISLNQ